MRHVAFRVLIALLALVGPSVGMAQINGTTTLSPNEIRLTAVGALRDSQPARALALSEALLVRNPEDLLALRVGAQAALEIGESDVAVRHGEALYYLTDDPQIRFFSARLVALAESQQEHFTKAQIWLRRARQSAPDSEAANAVAADYAAVRQRNPLSLSFEFGIRPSSNVNGGSSEDTFEVNTLWGILILPLNDAFQNLSGYNLSANAQMRYRLHETPTSFTTATFGLQTQQVWLSTNSRARAPDFDTDTLSTWRASTGIEHTWAVGPNNQPMNVAFNYAATLLDGDLYATELQLGLTRRWAVGDRASLRADVSLGQTDYRTTGFSADLWSAGVDWRRVLNNGQTLGLSAEVGRAQSDAARYAYTWQTVGASYNFGVVNERFDVGIAAQYRWRTYGSRSNNLVTREDAHAQLSVSVGLPDFEIYGFQPVVTLDVQKNQSTASVYRTEAVSLDVSFRSSF